MKNKTVVAAHMASWDNGDSKKLEFIAGCCERLARRICTACGDDPDAEFTCGVAEQPSTHEPSMTRDEFQALQCAVMELRPMHIDFASAPLESLANKEAIRRGYIGWREAHCDMTTTTGKDK